MSGSVDDICPQWTRHTNEQIILIGFYDKFPDLRQAKDASNHTHQGFTAPLLYKIRPCSSVIRNSNRLNKPISACSNLRLSYNRATCLNNTPHASSQDPIALPSSPSISRPALPVTSHTPRLQQGAQRKVRKPQHCSANAVPVPDPASPAPGRVRRRFPSMPAPTVPSSLLQGPNAPLTLHRQQPLPVGTVMICNAADRFPECSLLPHRRNAQQLRLRLRLRPNIIYLVCLRRRRFLLSSVSAPPNAKRQTPDAVM
ncbi:hypothetical protein C0993_006922 [Termitomyces sp. T159_Od127]|nr:hypothetical protein C0993_006922 [Termitomyces sp. T159_Od127]